MHYDAWEEAFTGTAALRGGELERWAAAVPLAPVPTAPGSPEPTAAAAATAAAAGRPGDEARSEEALPSVAQWEASEAAAAASATAGWAALSRCEARQWPEYSAAAYAAGDYEARRAGLAQAALELLGPQGLPAAARVWLVALALMDRAAAAGCAGGCDALFAAGSVLLASRAPPLQAAEGAEALAAAAAARAASASLDVALLADQLARAAAADPSLLPPGLAAGGGASLPAAVEAEADRLAAAVDGDLACATAIDAWQLYASRLGCDASNPTAAAAVLGDSWDRLLQLTGRPVALRHPPSRLAAAAVCLARRAAGAVPFWPSALAALTGLDEEAHPQVGQGGGGGGRGWTLPLLASWLP